MTILGTDNVPAGDNENLLGATPVLIIKLPGLEFSKPISQLNDPSVYLV